MRNGALPRELDLRGLAAREASISGVATLATLEPTRERGRRAGRARGQRPLRFRRDEEGRYVVEAHVKAEVVLECQRCLGEMTQILETRTVMACMWNDEDAASVAAQLRAANRSRNR